MISTFTPVENIRPGNTIKLTNSVQEWCGQVFMQMNARKNDYEIKSFSYFESEGDQITEIDRTLLEDEIYSLIRLNPDALPTGEIEIFPSSVYLRFMHKEVKTYNANANKSAANYNGNSAVNYTIEFPDLKRKLEIYYSDQFPYEILGWKDKYPSLRGQLLTTTATKKKELKIDYWNKNGKSDSTYYNQLFNY